jgi:hypothetical protein
MMILNTEGYSCESLVAKYQTARYQSWEGHTTDKQLSAASSGLIICILSSPSGHIIYRQV